MTLLVPGGGAQADEMGNPSETWSTPNSTISTYNFQMLPTPPESQRSLHAQLHKLNYHIAMFGPFAPTVMRSKTIYISEPYLPYRAPQSIGKKALTGKV